MLFRKKKCSSGRLGATPDAVLGRVERAGIDRGEAADVEKDRVLAHVEVPDAVDGENTRRRLEVLDVGEGEGVGALVAEQLVGRAAPLDPVIAGAALHHLVAGVAVEEIVARHAEEPALFGRAIHAVGIRGANGADRAEEGRVEHRVVVGDRRVMRLEDGVRRRARSPIPSSPSRRRRRDRTR